MVHRTIKNSTVLLSFNEHKRGLYLDSWDLKLDPQCAQVFWTTDNTATDFIKKYAPEYLYNYFYVKTGTERGDIARLVMLYFYGGLYCDIDTQILKPIPTWETRSDGIDNIVDSYFAMEYCDIKSGRVCTVQFSFAVRKNHPIMLKALSNVMNNIETQAKELGREKYLEQPKITILTRTGPYPLRDAVQWYLKQYNYSLEQVCIKKKPDVPKDTHIMFLPLYSFHFTDLYPHQYSSLRHHYEGAWK